MTGNEHWKTKVVGIQAKDIYELAEMVTEINMENFVIATQPIKVEQGYDALVFIKTPPREKVEEVLNIPNKPTDKQLRFLRAKKFKIEPNLTKEKATEMIKEYLERLNREKNIKREESAYEDY